MSAELSNVEKTRKLKWALAGDAANSVYVYLTFGGPIFLLFLDRLGLDKKQIGLVLAMFPFCGLIAPLIAPLVARLGFKRVYLGFWLTRKFVLLGLLAAPWVIEHYGPAVGFACVAAVLLVFALCRSIAEVGLTPWSQEYIPATIRGKFTAVQMIVIMIVGMLTVTAASWFLGGEAPLSKYLLLQAAAFVLGVASVAFFALVPGGAPVPRSRRADRDDMGIFAPLRDRVFRRFLLAGGLINLAWVPMTAFLPLFYKEQIGLRPDQVVMLESAVMLGTLVSCLFWGWAADRYGGKPVMMLNLVLLLLYPVGLLLLPRGQADSHLWAMGLVLVLGIVTPGWNTGYFRYLFVNLVPPEHKARYIAVHTAWNGLIVGACPLAAGYVLGHTAWITGRFGPVYLDAYTPLFVFCLALGAVSVAGFASLPSAGGIPVARFAAMFVQGDPVGAIRALIAYQLAGHESKRVTTIERLGQTRSPLSVTELIAALDDPSFNVRYEAIISIARTRRDAALTDAMIRMLSDGDPDLRTTAAWALGRMGDPKAAPELRAALDSEYPLLSARAARALGALGDRQAIPKLLSLLARSTDAGIQVAYASALAALGCEQVAPRLLELLDRLDTGPLRRELSLAIATLLGKDEQALRLWRRMHDQPGDTLAGVMLGLRKRLSAAGVCAGDSRAMRQSIDRCARLLGHNDLPAAVAELRFIGEHVQPAALTDTAALVLRHALARLEHHGLERFEYALLVVHALHVGLLPGHA